MLDSKLNQECEVIDLFFGQRRLEVINTDSELEIIIQQINANGGNLTQDLDQSERSTILDMQFQISLDKVLVEEEWQSSISGKDKFHKYSHSILEVEKISETMEDNA